MTLTSADGSNVTVDAKRLLRSQSKALVERCGWLSLGVAARVRRGACLCTGRASCVAIQGAAWAPLLTSVFAVLR